MKYCIEHKCDLFRQITITTQVCKYRAAAAISQQLWCNGPDFMAKVWSFTREGGLHYFMLHSISYWQLSISRVGEEHLYQFIRLLCSNTREDSLRLCSVWHPQLGDSRKPIGVSIGVMPDDLSQYGSDIQTTSKLFFVKYVPLLQNLCDNWTCRCWLALTVATCLCCHYWLPRATCLVCSRVESSWVWLNMRFNGLI